MKNAPARGYDAHMDEKALEQAEHDVETPPEQWGRPAFVHVPLEWISERPDLFPSTTQEVDLGHLDDLVRRVVRGEAIDPPLVMMIGEQWVCFEGHDRIAAYRTLEPKQTIKCEWFDGTVHEACR